MGTGELLGKPDEMLVGGGKPCDGLASHPGGSCNYPSCFLLRKQGPVPAWGGGAPLGLSTDFFLLPTTVPLISLGTSKLF